MVPDGFEGMDGRSAMLLGEINGKLESLIAEFQDEREQARIERRMMFETTGQLNVMRTELDALTHKVDGLKSQVYSNKTEIDKIKNTAENKQITATHTMKLAGILGTILAAIGGFLWMVASYVSSHWDSVSTFLKSKL